MNTIEQYIDAHIDDESELLTSIEREANIKLLNPRMIAGHLQGRVLKMFCRMMSAERVLEIGTYTGYATLCFAEGLPDKGEIYTIEINDELEDFINKQINASFYKEKIHLEIGDALEIIPQLDKTFDMVFIDADKRLYCEYYDLVFPKVRRGGLILADNTLWNGKVLEEARISDRQTIGIQNFNEKIKSDERVEKVILPIRDGLSLIRKK